jgi:hypothetical protein
MYIMITNNIFKYFAVCLVCCGITLAFTSCSKEEDPFFTIGGDDAPRILNTDFPRSNPDDENSAILFDIKRNEHLRFTLQVTPTDQTTISWLIDGKEVATGKDIDIALETGTYDFKVIARTNAGKESYRQGTLKVTPLDGDPINTSSLIDTYQEVGATVTVNGSNLGGVKQVKINDRLIDVTSAAEGSLQFVMPADMPEGEYRMSFIDDSGTVYGAGKIVVSGQSIVTESDFIATTAGQVSFTGRKLDNVATVTAGNQTCTIVTKTDDKITIQLPELADGTFELKANTYGGAAVMFVKDGALVETANIQVVQALIFQNFFLGQPMENINLTGDNLDKVATVTVNGQTCTIVSKNAEKMTVQLPDLPEGTFDLKATTTSGTAVKFIKNGELADVASVKVSIIAEDVVWEGTHAVEWDAIWQDAAATTQLKTFAKVGATLRLYVTRTATDYCKGCATVNWKNIMHGGEGDVGREDVDITNETTYIDFVLTAKSIELLNEGNLQVVGHGFTLTKITVVQPEETELWTGSHDVDWGSIWENSEVTAKLKTRGGIGSVLRLYVTRTATDYCKGCATVNWKNIKHGGEGDVNREDVDITNETTSIEFVLTAKSMELLNEGNLQVVGHGFTLTKVTIQ